MAETIVKTNENLETDAKRRCAKLLGHLKCAVGASSANTGPVGRPDPIITVSADYLRKWKELYKNYLQEVFFSTCGVFMKKMTIDLKELKTTFIENI